MKKSPKVFIVVLNYNGQDCLKRCLSSVFKTDYENFEVIVVDNGSVDGSLEMARQHFSRAIFIKNEVNLGFASGVNVGIRFALERMADYVVLLNYDTVVDANFLTKLIEAGQTKPKVGILSPLIFTGQNKEVWFAGGKIVWPKMRTKHFFSVSQNTPYVTSFISGCAMTIKAEVFEKVGLFDEDYFLYWEDADFSFRARKKGFELLMVPESWVYHFEKSEEQKPNKIYWLVFSGLLFFQKHASWWAWPYFNIYNGLRRIKNRLKIRKQPDDLLLKSVNKAFQDFYHARKN